MSNSDDASQDAPQRTGHERVDAVVDSLAGLDALEPGRHVEVYERAHGELREVLSRVAGETTVSSQD